MKLFNSLEKVGINPIVPLKIEEKNYIAKSVADKIARNIAQLSESYNELYMRIYNCNMLFAKVDPKYRGIFYYYKNNTIYIDETRSIMEIDEYMIHECIHYLQNFSNITKKDNRAGLCEFTELKIKGLGINEAIVQYITAQILGEKVHRVSNSKIAIYTNSENYYKYMTSLATQVIFLVGEKQAIDSTINTNDNFENLLYNTFEENTDRILKNFDSILDENNSQTRDENKIIDIYLETQELIYTTYFTKACKYLTSSYEVDREVDKLEKYDKILGTLIENDTCYQKFLEFKQNISSVFFKKYVEINKARTRNSLATISRNPLNRLWKKIINFINGNREKN